MKHAQKIIERYGGTRAFSRSLGISSSAVQWWKKKGVIPAKRLLDIEEKLGIPREELRPDLYRTPSPPTQRSAS